MGGAQPPVLGGFHLNSASCVYILSPPQNVVLGGCSTSKVSEMGRISGYLTQNLHSMKGETETQRYTWRPFFRIQIS